MATVILMLPKNQHNTCIHHFDEFNQEATMKAVTNFQFQHAIPAKTVYQQFIITGKPL
jgi:hypothetical protein